MRPVGPCIPALVLALAAAAPPAGGAEGDGVRSDEETVRSAGLATDGAALAEFLRRRTPGEKARENIEKLVGELGHPRFKVRESASRELVVIGPAALVPLRRALQSGDREVELRAKRC